MSLSTPEADAFQAAHTQSDTDNDRTAMHHTLGRGSNQAAPGNHNHDNDYISEDDADDRYAAVGHVHDAYSPDKDIEIQPGHYIKLKKGTSKPPAPGRTEDFYAKITTNDALYNRRHAQYDPYSGLILFDTNMGGSNDAKIWGINPA